MQPNSLITMKVGRNGIGHKRHRRKKKKRRGSTGKQEEKTRSRSTSLIRLSKREKGLGGVMHLGETSFKVNTVNASRLKKKGHKGKSPRKAEIPRRQLHQKSTPNQLRGRKGEEEKKATLSCCPKTTT